MGELAKMLQKADDQFALLHNQPRPRVVERGGKKLQDILVKANPWGDSHCGREECQPCEGGLTGKCQAEGAVYSYTCDRCKVEDERLSQYIGETSRTLFQRTNDHRAAMEREDEDNAMVKHQYDWHDGEKCSLYPERY